MAGDLPREAACRFFGPLRRTHRGLRGVCGTKLRKKYYLCGRRLSPCAMSAMNSRKLILLLLGCTAAFRCGAAQAAPAETKTPALAVNIVISGVPYEFFNRYEANLAEDGFRRFMREGTVFTESRYEYMPTNSVSSLATLTTGAYPSVHGIVGQQWCDVLTGQTVSLIADPSATGFDSEYGEGCYSGANLTTPTLGDRLRRDCPGSKVISVATDPASAIVMAGLGTEAYWLNPRTACWTSSSDYMLYLPGWVTNFNEQYKNNSYFTNWFWTLCKAEDRYRNDRICAIHTDEKGRFRQIEALHALPSMTAKGRFPRISATPLANDMVADFVRQVVLNEGLGDDDTPDLLNICFDAPRKAISHYGPESVEAEDMFYHLDRTIASLIRFIELETNGRVVFVLTTDHGTSDSYDAYSLRAERFNGTQFRTIINSFLCAQYGGESWVSGYFGRRLYINRNEAFSRGLSLDEVQRRASDFALQFRGIARVVPSCDLRSGAATDRYLQRLRNGYYQKRSGDLLVDLEPGLIEERTGVRASTGSAFEYDIHVPLMIMGYGIPAGISDEEVEMTSVAVTLARLLGISQPDASSALPLRALIDTEKK